MLVIGPTLIDPIQRVNTPPASFLCFLEEGNDILTLWKKRFLVYRCAYDYAGNPARPKPHALLKKTQEAGWRRVDALDWVYQSWAYDQHDVGATPGFNGDYQRALRSIKAKTLILAGSIDLLNPEYEAMEAAKYISDVRYVAINEKRPMGHVSGAGISAPENDVQNHEIARFLETLLSGRR